MEGAYGVVAKLPAFWVVWVVGFFVRNAAEAVVWWDDDLAGDLGLLVRLI